MHKVTLRTIDGDIVPDYPVSVDSMPYGYINFYGDKLTASQVDRYNHVNDHIKRRIAGGFKIDEADLNNRHQALII